MPAVVSVKLKSGWRSQREGGRDDLLQNWEAQQHMRKGQQESVSKNSFYIQNLPQCESTCMKTEDGLKLIPILCRESHNFGAIFSKTNTIFFVSILM